MHKLGRYTLSGPLGISVLVSLLGGCEAPPHRPYPGPEPAPYSAQYPAATYPKQPQIGYSYEEIPRCRADTQRSHAEVVRLFERVRRAGSRHPAYTLQFNLMDERLKNLREQLAREELSVQECQSIGGAIASERNEVINLSRALPRQ